MLNWIKNDPRRLPTLQRYSGLCPHNGGPEFNMTDPFPPSSSSLFHTSSPLRRQLPLHGSSEMIPIFVPFMRCPVDSLKPNREERKSHIFACLIGSSQQCQSCPWKHKDGNEKVPREIASSPNEREQSSAEHYSWFFWTCPAHFSTFLDN